PLDGARARRHRECQNPVHGRAAWEGARLVRIRKIVIALALGALLTVVAPNAAQAAGKPSNGCPSGFNLGALTAEQILELPRSQAAIAAGVVDEAGIRAAVAGVDKNGTGRICVSL